MNVASDFEGGPVDTGVQMTVVGAVRGVDGETYGRVVNDI